MPPRKSHTLKQNLIQVYSPKQKVREEEGEVEIYNCTRLFNIGNE